MRKAQRAWVRGGLGARCGDAGGRWRSRRRTVLAALLAIVLALGTACGPTGVGNGAGIGDGNGNGTGGPGDAGGGQVADLGGEYGVTALVDGVRFTATVDAHSVGYGAPSRFTLMAQSGVDGADGYWAVTGSLVDGPQACDMAAPTFFSALLPAPGDGYHVALDCAIEVDAYEVGEEVAGLGAMIAITGRFAGTMREFLPEVGYVGPVRAVTNGVFDIALPEP